VNGILVGAYSDAKHHWQASRTLSEWMDEEGVPGLQGIDTRSLTKMIRSNPTLLARIETPGNIGAVGTAFVNPDAEVLQKKVSTRAVQQYGDGETHIVVVDCGVKHNILRHLLDRGTRLSVVPYDYDYTSMAYDGVFVSNGPGDPRLLSSTVSVLRKAMEIGKPIFGICMGNQIMGLAAGASIDKMDFGNRGHNQPVINELNHKSYITSQNHGYAVQPHDLAADEWTPLFTNLNDGSNEGLIHKTKPFTSVQFHPEARGGPNDTFYLFDQFVTQCRQQKLGRPVANFFRYPSLRTPQKVLVLGSGGLQIGQAGEFDYSGSQAIKSYSAMGIETVLINPNIASIQTSRGLADSVYYLPVNVDFVTQVIEKEQPDAIALSFGGQTALNVGVALHDQGILAKHGVAVLGTSIDSIKQTEDRELFVERLSEIGEPTPVSIPTANVDEAIAAAEKIGYPVICRAAYALGGLGSGFCDNERELVELLSMSFTKSPQVLVERDLRGWKEVEYEVVRDSSGNAITVCNMENFDPLGIHTGDSIVVAPSQTLTNDEYHMLRESSIKIASHLGIIGECNVQYALHPESMQYAVIEANPRLSRSSALASKATGYPLAAVAAQLSLDVKLHQLTNPITSGEMHSTSAFFEPSLDYCVVKVPRWDTSKFEHVSNQLGSAMRSVGEVMSIGRSFEEALQKACRMVSDSYRGFEPEQFPGPASRELIEMVHPTPNRLFAIANVLFHRRMSVDDVHGVTKIDKWFLDRLQSIVDTSDALHEAKAHVRGVSASDGSALRLTYNASAPSAPTGVEDAALAMHPSVPSLLRTAKERGFSDVQIGARWGLDELAVRALRRAFNILPAVKQIDTLGGEYPATTNYLYTTYNGCGGDDVAFDDHGVLVLGSGTYRIGSSVEFDYCSTKTVHALRDMGIKSVMLNHNPETVSTDYDENDRLYFDELSLEKVLDVYEKEASRGIIVSVGGQAPNNVALGLHRAGATILGTHPTQIDRCEDRSAYSSMLDELGVEQPSWVSDPRRTQCPPSHAIQCPVPTKRLALCALQVSVTSDEEAHGFCQKVGYPCLVRPSYVLSGAAMNVVYGAAELGTLLAEATTASPDHPVVISKFIDGALEIDVDAVANKGEVVAYAISEHLERGGVHSGDATLVLPPFRLSESAKARMKLDTAKIAKELNVSGPFNTQFLVAQNASDDEWVGVIETNLRASRSIPFVSKVLDVDFIDRATQCIMGEDSGLREARCEQTPKHSGVKSPQFSFARLLGADPVLGVEMHSTGEVACFGETVEEAYLKSLVATHFKLPSRGDSLLVCARHGSKGNIVGAVDGVKHLASRGFFVVAADEETQALLAEQHLESSLMRPDQIAKRELALVLDLSDNDESFYPTRRSTVDYSIPLITNHEQIILFAKALDKSDTLLPMNYDEHVPPA